MLKHLAGDCCCSMMTSFPARIQCWRLDLRRGVCVLVQVKISINSYHLRIYLKLLFLKIPKFCVQVGHC